MFMLILETDKIQLAHVINHMSLLCPGRGILSTNLQLYCSVSSVL